MSGDLSLDSRHALVSGQGAIPVLGLGVCVSTKCDSSILSALKAGYRHIDTAQIYYVSLPRTTTPLGTNLSLMKWREKNEKETGTAVKTFLSQNPSVVRADIFVCSKLWETDLSRPDMPTSFVDLCNGGPWPLNSLESGHTTYTRAAAVEGLNRSLAVAGLDYFDLYLLHNPRPGPQARLQAWLGLQDAMAAGKARAIGVSNFSPAHIEDLMSQPGVHTLPAVNQIELHPWNQQRVIREYCARKNIIVTAYSPLTQGQRLGDKVIGGIARKVGKTPAQVVLRWCLQVGVVVIPKSDREERIVENKGLFGWELDGEDMEAIDGLDEGQKGNLGEWDPFALE